MIGWTGKKEEKDRKFLSDLKKLTTDYNDMAFQIIKEKINNFITLLIKRVGLVNIETNHSLLFL